MSNFKVGDKVVCVDDSPQYNNGDKCLVKDHIYTVVKIGILGGTHVDCHDEEYEWVPSRFRKLEDKDNFESNEASRSLAKTAKDYAERKDFVPTETPKHLETVESEQ